MNASTDFVPAQYGYWITREGETLAINQRDGHVPALMEHEKFIYLSPSQPYCDWYEAALARGWVRVIAPAKDRRLFRFQFVLLALEAQQALVDLLGGLAYDRYILEAAEYQMFSTAEDAIRFVQAASITSFSTATWTM